MPVLFLLLFLLTAAARAHDFSRPRSLSGLHSGAFAAAHRASVRAERAATLPPQAVRGGSLPGSVAVTVSPAGPLAGDMAVVNVSFTFLAGEVNRTSDWLGQVCVGFPIEDYIEFSPVDYFHGWAGGAGWLTFPLFRSRCDFQMVYYRGRQPLWPAGVALGQSRALSWAGSWADAPFHTHLAYGGEDAQHSMVISFTTNRTRGGGGGGGGLLVQLGTAPGVYDLPNATSAESTTYGAQDLCNAPANTTSVDYWQWPGVFHHVTARGLQPGTRYYARPVAGGVPGDEVTFVTGKALGPDVPVSFASFGDMSVTQYVLDGDSGHDMPDGGPGAVGTARRLRERIDSANDVDFVTHYGDLGYAKGAVFLWDAWMAMMAHVGSRVPYMVSVGKCAMSGSRSARACRAPPPAPHARAHAHAPLFRSHEYDYRYPSPNDPSGASAAWKPSWWDGDVDSLGECGVGTQQRFRSPLNGNGIFWYSFAVGSATIITLSSEHDLAPGSPQGEFLARQLAAVNRSLTPWLVVSLHRMMYSLTGSEQPQQDGFRALLEDVFARARVDLVMMGHIHSSQRTCAVYNSTCTPGAPVYIISGSAGAMLEPYPLDDPRGLVQFYDGASCGSYVVSIANSTHMRLTWTRNSDGAVRDDAWLVKAA